MISDSYCLCLFVFPTEREEGLCAKSESVCQEKLIEQIKYQLPEPSNPLDDPDYEPPPPTISNGFFAWFSPVVHVKEEQMIANVGA
jgi:hypothetical protein